MHGTKQDRLPKKPVLLLYARHGRHLYGESPEWGLASAYH
jgi:hypothetical protein